MATTWIMKFPQVDKPTQPILVHVTRKQPNAFNLDLLATDGTEAYRTKVRERNLAKLRSSNFEGTDDEWKALLHYTLVSKKDSGASENHIKSLQVDAVISGREPDAVLSITLRSRIEDITHRLGAIDLPYSDNTDDVDLFGWASLLADQRDELELQSVKDTKEVTATKSTIQTLEKQLAELVKAKAEHEDQLLTKFAMLLNEKKLRIRDQQRVLQTSNVNKKELEKLQTKIGVKDNNTTTKRKRDAKVQAENVVEDEESDGFEAMDVDKDEDTASEDEGEGQARTPSRSASPEAETTSKAKNSTDLRRKVSGQSFKAGKKREPSPPPPPRQLPFQTNGPKQPQQKKVEFSKPTTITGDDDETASEDDEL